ncbi:MAG: arylamine N-acetyltransferase [Chloroflexota bacterium]|nr:arylamine N-acetyltransferase [Chloroflexota bacterium]
MTATPPLDGALATRVLQHFGLPDRPQATESALRRLLDRYTRIVPWESASRIVRRAKHESQDDCPVFAEAFWESALERGTGGTCYESNYAFFSLLRRLGYDGYLTINDMATAIGCHSAIIIWLEGRKRLVDVGYPLYAVLPLPERETAAVESPFFRYKVEGAGEKRYRIWRRPHPQELAFTLVDEPVSDADYRAITVHDYRHDGGQFLNEIVIHKVIDDQLWRFNSDDPPWHLQVFVDGQRENHYLDGDVAGQLASRFNMDHTILGEAMQALGLM